MQPCLQVQDLHAGYNGKTVLQGVSFQVLPAEIRVLLGGSGCGKSTLLNYILGLEKYGSGLVRYFGAEFRVSIDPLPISVRRNMGVLFQNGALLSSLSVSENVGLPIRVHKPWIPPEVRRELIAQKLELVGLLSAWNKLPSELSGGMKKRAALARAMALDPQLLLCDEPSAGLDPITSFALDELLLSLRAKSGVSILVVTHELRSIAAIADSVLYLAGGGIIFDGTLEDAMKSEISEIKSFFLPEGIHATHKK
jgi:phospholipid/cholesterol/gamma-HCH transport system ATP-binding protein